MSSIKRIIAHGPERADGQEAGDGAVPEDAPVIHLTPPDPVTDQVIQDVPPLPVVTLAEPALEDLAVETILSDSSTQAARDSLSQLSALLVRPADGESNTLEGLVREMLRPMLKEWLDTRLPEMVEGLVKKEIDRIVGRLG
ncbi:MAG: DUF2497 domain-containing protein [Sphingobium sp.]